jgi:hypothetical protein
MMSVNCAWKSSRLILLQCFYWVENSIIRSYSFDVVEPIIHCLWQFKVVCYPYWWLHKVYLNVFMKIKDETVKHIKNFVTLMKTDCSDYSLKHLHWLWSISILSWRTGLQSTASSENLHTLFTWRKRRFWAAKSHYLQLCTSYAQRLWPELTPLIKSH